MKERWKPFANGNYAVSNFGRVKRITAGKRTKPGQLMKLVKMKIGYYQVMPTIDGRNVHFYVHRLVAEMFIGPCQSGQEVNHRDGNKLNNHVSNLEYVTHRENMNHAHRKGLIKAKRLHSDSVIRRIRKCRKLGMSYSEISKTTGVSIGHCWQVVNGNTRIA